ncbi:MAG: HAMP domain-containing sensor histidine kinase [Clostridium sp.]
MKNFSNPELRKSSMMLIIIAILFIGIINIVITVKFNDIKNSYIDGRAAMIGTIADKYPDLESEIVANSFITPSDEKIERGKAILEDYGYKESLHIKFMGSLNEVFISSRLVLSFMWIAIVGILLILNYFQYERIYSRVRNITNVSKQILEGNYDINIYEEKEGDFAKLSYGFSNMRQIIQNQMIDLKNEKEFLVNILSDISHQLKTPLATLMVYNDILARERITKEDKTRFLDNNRSQLDRMNWLIKSMLKLARVDARAIEFNVKENNLVDTIKAVIDSLQVMSIENNVEVIFEDGNGVENKGFIFKYDDHWLGEALINIIKNGIEHSNGGRIQISMEENIINTKIIVKDNGEGISEKDIPNIFKRFYKNGKTDSVGIGLSLSKSIVEAQNGYIEVESEIGVGSEFRIILIRSQW